MGPLKRNAVATAVLLAFALAAAAAGPADEVARALKAALEQGSRKAVASLGKPDGFFKNADVHIPLPAGLKRIERGLRAVGQGRYADEFELTINRAAEAAMPEARDVLVKAVSRMTLSDARDILRGADDAATSYFRKKSAGELRERLLPIVKDATRKTGVTQRYETFVRKAGPVAVFLKAPDLDGYVCDKALEGLFLMIAREEKEIRKNPAARATALLRKIFG